MPSPKFDVLVDAIVPVCFFLFPSLNLFSPLYPKEPRFIKISVNYTEESYDIFYIFQPSGVVPPTGGECKYFRETYGIFNLYLIRSFFCSFLPNFPSKSLNLPHINTTQEPTLLK